MEKFQFGNDQLFSHISGDSKQKNFSPTKTARGREGSPTLWWYVPPKTTTYLRLTDSPTDRPTNRRRDKGKLQLK